MACRAPLIHYRERKKERKTKQFQKHDVANCLKGKIPFCATLFMQALHHEKSIKISNTFFFYFHLLVACSVWDVKDAGIQGFIYAAKFSVRFHGRQTCVSICIVYMTGNHSSSRKQATAISSQANMKCLQHAAMCTNPAATLYCCFLRACATWATWIPGVHQPCHCIFTLVWKFTKKISFLHCFSWSWIKSLYQDKRKSKPLP